MKIITKVFLAVAFGAACVWSTSGGLAVMRSISFHDSFDSGNLDRWLLPSAADWEILEGTHGHYLHMVRKGEPGVPRRPLQYALLKNEPVGSFIFQTRLRREGKSMIVVFNYVDTMHFYYAHLSVDRGEKQPVHNGIFIVNGGPRKRIAGISADPALPDTDWHQVRVARNVHTGSIEVFMDQQSKPLFSVVDHTFSCGLVGMGSFDETGDFAAVNLHSNDAGCKPGSIIQPASMK
ncbi:MAG TPA: hypothetical protein VG028_18545 [Terriglobia bacterium]|nr:hypothetical protein [Terriglobia bacterium]